MTAGPGRLRRLAIVGAWLAALPGCGGIQSTLDPAGPQADRIGRLIGINVGVLTSVYLVVMAAVAGAMLRRGRRLKTPVTLNPPPIQEEKLTRLVAGSVIGTAGVLLFLIVGDFLTGRAIHAMADPEALTIRVTGHQWWWEVNYQDRDPSRGMTTANEVHIPVGRTVHLDLRSTDVIHSFWIPNLHGKRDMIPGQSSHVYLRADRPGTYWGQCAEFCGYEHAFMKFAVVAEPEREFEGWLEARRRDATEPAGATRRRGREVFLGSTCVMCHTIRGTLAMSRVGPDLTHLGGRPLVGSILPNTRGHLAGWVVDPQRIKPGVRMPPNPIRPEDLDPLLDYLESLE